MAVTLIVNGIPYSYPTVGDEEWGEDATIWAQAISTATIHKTGGLFELTSELDLGSLNGVMSLYFKSRSADSAAGGVVKLSVGDSINWRNTANSGDNVLSVTADNLVFNGQPIGGLAEWGSITGTLTDQVDLQAALDLKADQTSLDAHTGDVANPHNTDVTGLSDTIISSPNLGQVLTYNGADWINSNVPSSVGQLDDLTDVTVPTPLDGQVLTYEQSSLQWKSVTTPAGVTDHDLLTNNGGVGSHVVISNHIADGTIHFTLLDGLSDVDTTGVADGQLLSYSSGTAEWLPINPPSTGDAIWGLITGTLTDQLDLQAALDLKTNETDFVSHTGDGTIHFVIDDAVPDLAKAYSSQNIQTALDLKADQTSLSNHIADNTNPHSTSLSNLPDTAITTPLTDHGLVYIGGQWINQVIEHGTLGGLGNDDHPLYAKEAVTASHIADATIHFTEASIDHLNILNNGTNSHAAIDTHIGDGTLHFTEGSISHLNINDIGANTHNQIDTHISNGTIHFTEAAIDHANILSIGANSHDVIDTHIADGTLHFTEGSISHLNINDIGANSHDAIDTHISNGTIHFTEAAIDHNNIVNNGINSHVLIDNHIAGSGLNHPASDITFDDTVVGGGFTEVQSVLDFFDDQIGLRETAATGVISGGLVTQASATTVDITLGAGEIVDGYTDRRNPVRTNISWSAVVGYTILMPATNGTQIIFFDNLGVIQQQASPMNPQQRRNLIQIAFVNYEAGAITSISQAGILSNEVGNTLYDWIYFTNSDDRVLGLGIKPVTNQLQIWGDTGELFSPGINVAVDLANPNIKTFAAIGGSAVPATFDVMFADGTIQAAGVTVVPNYFESAPGVITSLPGNDAAIHYVYRTIDNMLMLQLGTTQYPTAQAARDQLAVDRTNYVAFVGSESTLLSAQIYVEGNAPDFNDPNDAAIVSTIGGSGTSSGVQVSNYLDLTDVDPTSYVGAAGQASVVNQTETGMEFQENGFGKLNWITPYAEGPTFFKDDVVKDGTWTMVCNDPAGTIERAAPQAIGNKENNYTGLDPTQISFGKQILYGTRYTLDQEIFASAFRIWTVIGNRYELFRINDPLGAGIITELVDFTATSAGWVNFPIDLELGLVGQVFDIVIRVHEAEPSAVVVTANYNYQTQTNDTVPASGEIRQSNKTLEELWISKTDSDSGDQTANLASLSVGDIIELLGSNDRYSIQAVGLDSGTYYKFPVAPAASSPTTGVQAVNFETTAVVGITNLADVDWWLTNGIIPSQGLFIIDGRYSDIAVTNTAYGVDVIYQVADISQKWDVLATSSGGGAGSSEIIQIRDDLLGNGDSTTALSANMGYVLDQAKEDKTVVAAHIADATNPHLTSVDNLTNTVISGIVDGQVLTYDNGTSRWINSAPNLSHLNLTEIGTNSHAAIDTHIADGTLHFTEGSISHLNINDIGANTHNQIDTHISNGTIHFTENSISHLNINDIGANSHNAIDTHISNGTIHFTEAAIDHANILSIGTNSHALIDTHIADGTIHYTQAAISITESQISDLQSYLFDITNENLSDLFDVNTTSPVIEHVLAYDSAEWVNADLIFANLDDISDVNVLSVTDGQVLTYDNATSTWINTTPSGGGGATFNWLIANNGSDFNVAPTAAGLRAIGLGNAAQAGGVDSLAIGTSSTANFDNAVAIGNVQATQINEAHFGTNDATNKLVMFDGELELFGTTAQIHHPRYTTANLPAGALGATTFDSDTKELKLYDGTAWNPVGGGGGGGEDYVVINSTDALPTATGTDAIAIGGKVNTGGFASIAIGNTITTPAANLNIAIAYKATFNSNSGYNVMIGSNLIVGGATGRCVIIGKNAKGRDNAVAIGNTAQAYTSNSVAIGSNQKTTVTDEMLIGTGTTHRVRMVAGTFELTGTAAQFVQPNYTTLTLPTGTLGGTVFDTDTSTVKVYDGAAWVDIGGGGGGVTDHDLLTNNGGAGSHVAISNHIADGTVHFTQAAISITESQVSDLDKYTQLEVDNLLVPLATDADLTAHTGDATIHFTQAAIDHTAILSIGTNTHDQIDTHIIAKSPHNNWMDAHNGADFSSPPAAAGYGAIAIGNSSSATQLASTAIGFSAVVNSGDGVAIGRSAIVGSGSASSVSLGLQASCSGGYKSVSAGAYATVTGVEGVAIGSAATVNGDKGIAIGKNATAQTLSIAIGEGSTADVSTYSLVLSTNNTATQINQKNTGSVHLVGTDAQFVQPNYTTAALPIGTSGGTVFDTDTSTVKVYDGAAWVDIGGGGGGVTDHDLLTNNGGAGSHVAISNHIADGTVHFTQAAISITESQISDLQSYEPANANIQAHIIDTANPHGTSLASLPDTAITTPVDTQTLIYSGGQWINSAPAAAPADVNKVDSIPVETGETKVVNMVSMTQAAYDLITPNATTFYVIVG